MKSIDEWEAILKANLPTEAKPTIQGPARWWFEYRRYATATDIPVILGLSPWEAATRQPEKGGGDTETLPQT